MVHLTMGIAGAGIAGLVAGMELQRAGHSVTIFESRSRTGGRIQSLQVHGMVIESGPEFIHGNLKETFKLLDKYKIRYDSLHGKMYRAKNGHMMESYDTVQGWDKLLNEMKSLQEDLPFQEFLLQYFPEDRYDELRSSAIRYAEGYDLADTQLASTQGLLSEWRNEEAQQFRIPAGYETLVGHIEHEYRTLGGKILLNHRVEKVQWNSSEVRLTAGGGKFDVEKLIISLPVSLLNHSAPRAETIDFIPSLDEKNEAFNQIGFGTVIKIVIIWNSAFWQPLVPEAQFIFADYFIPVWWTQYPSEFPVLTGWLGGPRASLLAGKPDTFFLEKALESLSFIFSVSTEELKMKMSDFRIFNWINEPWSHGAYTYSKVGSAAARAICRKPVQNRIYFTGEAYYEGPYPGTVEAAVVSGLETARQVLNDL